ncbi:unnamed protein product [Prorocentrum cordatum]|uniref:Mei2-like C-terminal RNA recognition motif domain-containing protein n=1 Tax=Prorocentrum cordatum TaxID=2364126 RepID=A0ABN9T867_9DINO|nr:unnamed protein product [Polarella glacialis]
MQALHKLPFFVLLHATTFTAAVIQHAHVRCRKRRRGHDGHHQEHVPGVRQPSRGRRHLQLVLAPYQFQPVPDQHASEDASSGRAAAADDDDDSSWPDASGGDAESVRTAPSDDSRTTDADFPTGLVGRPPQCVFSDLLQVQGLPCGEKDLCIHGAPKAQTAPTKVGAPQSDPRPPASPGRAVAAVPGAPVQEKAVDHEVTPQGSTVMLKALPSQYTRDMLIELLQSKGFLQHCNFLYLPMNFKLSQNVGYAFLNLTCKEETKRFFDVFDGFSDWAVEWDQASTVWWSDTKGLNANIERYRNSPMMRDDVPDIFKPILLSGGKRISFPSPTKQHLPRIRCRKGHGIRVKMSQPDDSFGQ